MNRIIVSIFGYKSCYVVLFEKGNSIILFQFHLQEVYGIKGTDHHLLCVVFASILGTGVQVYSIGAVLYNIVPKSAPI